MPITSKQVHNKHNSQLSQCSQQVNKVKKTHLTCLENSQKRKRTREIECTLITNIWRPSQANHTTKESSGKMRWSSEQSSLLMKLCTKEVTLSHSEKKPWIQGRLMRLSSVLQIS